MLKNITKMKKEIKKIAVLTSGGDAPGMNAAIVGIVRGALSRGIEVIGIRKGFRGLVEWDVFSMSHESVSNIRMQAGTVLGTSRYPEFQDPKVRERAVKNLRDNQIDALIVIGGNGSYQGAMCLSDEALKYGISIGCMPATIDNDVNATDKTIGFSSCKAWILEYLKAIRSTASSHNRVFVVQTMGRHCGDLALHCGLAAGAEFILVPEVTFNVDNIASSIKEQLHQGKKHIIVLVAEGVQIPERVDPQSLEPFRKILSSIPSEKRDSIIENLTSRSTWEEVFHFRLSVACYIASELRKRNLDCHTDDVGYAQRGPDPTESDIILGLKMGHFVLQKLFDGSSGVAVAVQRGDLVLVPLKTAIMPRNNFDRELYQLSKVLN